ncbi:MAG: DNA repair protein RecN [Clostridia bacterium]
MITNLLIENIALIDKLELELFDGLNILSGETGAGKSIIIDSLNFVLGERADKTLIRYGTNYSAVEAVFSDYQNENICEYLQDIGVDCDDILIIRRKMTVENKNECRINGKLTTLSILKGLTELLVDIHGQHEHQSLLKPSNHIALLDNTDSGSVLKLKDEVKIAHENYCTLKAELEKFGDSDSRMRRLDVLNFQIEEIKKAEIADGEEDELLEKRKRIRNMEKILTALETANNTLDGYDGTSVTAELKNSISALSQVVSYDERLNGLSSRLDDAKAEITDVASTLNDMLQELDFDAKSSDAVEERLELVRNLFRKYGGNFNRMQEFLSSAVEEADMLTNAEERVEQLEMLISKASKQLLATATTLTEKRKNLAEKFEKAMIRELGDLGMAGSTFNVDFKTTEDIDKITANGADTVEFLISPNLGEPLKPLAKIISGGEMSRFMLALKNIIANVDGIGTMVFDEIDTGISGNIAEVVAEKMCNISRNRQVLAVTHMSTLASMADHHYLIEKSVENGKTLTHVHLLEDDTVEIARLIGGSDYSTFALPHAKEMKTQANKYKAKISSIK